MTPKELVAFWLDLLHWCHVLKKSGWCKAEGSWDLEGVERVPGVRGFSIQPRRWVVERTFGWLSRSRRLSKDYERKVPSLRNAHPDSHNSVADCPSGSECLTHSQTGSQRH